MPAKISFLLVGAVLLCVSAFKINDSDLDTIVQKLETWSKMHPQEKVYLHLNKSLFITGDTMYCKAYVVTADRNTPSSISRIVYLDLTDDKGSIHKTLVLPLSDGIGWCAIPINTSLKAGSYHIRAYTNWMKNFDGFFFDKSVTILDGSDNKPSLAKTQLNHKIYFFPEGGQMVDGLPVRTAFKAVGINGLGLSVSGNILDESGKKVINFQSGFAGMGSFVFTPSPQHTYSAAVQYGDGFEDKAMLPEAEPNGYVMMIDNFGKDNIIVNITAKDVPGDVVLIAQSGNQVQYSSKLTLQNGTVNVNVSKKKFPTGIVQFTLFSGNDLPVAERLVFVNHNDQLGIATQLDKSTSGKREKVMLKLHVTDNLDEPVTGSFSVAVTDAATVPYDEREESITANLLLTSDLKGFVENPSYYFISRDSGRLRDLDNLLLTQGWRRFQWKDVLADTRLPLLYAAEKSLSLSGQVKSERGKPLSGATVSLLSKNGDGLLLQTQTDSGGNFRFEDLAATGDIPFALQALTKEGSKNAMITVNDISVPVANDHQIIVPETTNDSNGVSYFSANQTRWEERKKFGLIADDIHTLKNVTVITTKLTKMQQAVAPSYNLNGPGNADQVLTYDDLFNCHDLSHCLPGKVTGIIFKSVIDPVSHTWQTKAFSTQSGSAMEIILDGVPSPLSLNEIPASDIQAIEVLRSGGYLAVYGFQGSGGVLVITTKKGNLDYNHLDDNKPVNKNLLFTTIHGYTVRREFYSPDYSVAPNNTTTPDLRSTIYWQPNVVTDDDGNATIEWYNADVTGKYNIVIEGISADGRIGNTSLNYTVK